VEPIYRQRGLPALSLAKARHKAVRTCFRDWYTR
jgi:hypothetical protein